jgi:hypothetical protein
MSNDADSSLPARWRFQPTKATTTPDLQWEWAKFDGENRVVLRAETPLQTLIECIEDAKKHGYVEPARPAA